jgi:hypothetical protein
VAVDRALETEELNRLAEETKMATLTCDVDSWGQWESEDEEDIMMDILEEMNRLELRDISGMEVERRVPKITDFFKPCRKGVVEMDWEDVPVLDITWLERQERLEKARRLQLDWVEERTRRTLLQGCAKEMLVDMAWEELLVLEKSRRTEKAMTRRKKWLEEERTRRNVEMTCVWSVDIVQKCEEQLQAHQLAIAIH